MKRILAIVLLGGLLLTGLAIPALGTEAAVPVFSDVPAGAWYEQAVLWAAERGISAGVGEGRFGPGLRVTRGQLVTMLWRIASSPEPSGSAPFSDVPEGKWYSKAIAWAAENNIAAGYPGRVFAPNRAITRQELVTILYGRAKQTDSSVTAPDTDLSGYADCGEISAYALEAMRWAVGNGIVSGSSASALSPRSGATRAQLVQMLYRWLAEPGGETPVDPSEPTEPTGDEWELPFIPTP